MEGPGEWVDAKVILSKRWSLFSYEALQIYRLQFKIASSYMSLIPYPPPNVEKFQKYVHLWAIFSKELAEQLKRKLAEGRKATSSEASSSSTKQSRGEGNEEDVILTKTDKHGNLYPLRVSGNDTEPRRKRKKLKKVMQIIV